MDEKSALKVKLFTLASRLHALEDVFLVLHPDKKKVLEEAFVKHMEEALSSLRDEINRK
jgi:predicted component of type VI protein secretion system